MAYLCDVRGGCVAVYQEPSRNCLSLPMSAFVYYQHGKYSPVSFWSVPAWRVREAQFVCNYLNSTHLTLRAVGRAYAAAHMAGIAVSDFFSAVSRRVIARR